MSHINLDLQASHKMLLLLDEANANTESVIDQIPGIFLIVNENHEVLRANNEFVGLFGLDVEDVFRLPLAKFFRKEGWKIFAHHIKEVVESDDPSMLVRFEMGLAIGRGGVEGEHPFHWILTKRQVKNQGEGRLISVFGHDISEMRETERRLMEVFTSIPLGIFTLTRDATVGDSHSAYLETMLDSGKLVGRPVEDVLFKPAMATMDEEAAKGVQAVKACLGKSELEYGGFARTFPQEIFRNTKTDPKDGRWLKITYQPIIFDGVVEQLLIILEDRTAIVNAEREMMEAARDREKAEAMEKQSLALYESAIRDPLTKLYTRLYMKDAVAALLWSHDHHETAEVALVMFDIDHFKKVNDTYGHKNGDVILSQVAAIILAQVGEAEIPIRFGGEEFIIFCPTGADAMYELAERVRKEVEAKHFDLGDRTIQATISGGIAAHRKGESLDDFMHRTDQLLYKAKKNGRNQNMLERRAPHGERDASVLAETEGA